MTTETELILVYAAICAIHFIGAYAADHPSPNMQSVVSTVEASYKNIKDALDSKTEVSGVSSHD